MSGTDRVVIRTGQSRRRQRNRVVAVLTAAALGVSLLTQQSHAAVVPDQPASKAVEYHGKALTLEAGVAGAAWKPSPMKAAPKTKPLSLTATAFPAAATAEIAVPGTNAARVRGAASVGGLTEAPGVPVLVGAPASGAAAGRALADAGISPGTTGATRAPAKVTVTVGSHAAAVAAGVTGVVVSVARADGQTGPATVAIGIDYSKFAQAFGGDLPDRLRLVALPACALTTPHVAACRKQRPVTFVDDRAGKKLTATVTLPGATASASSTTKTTGARLVMAATSAPAGSTGTYTATSLSASNGWNEAGNTGSFTYSYPITVPPALGGSAPGVALSYDSGSVDGKTAVENAQPSWIGEGWDYSPGYIERSYVPCSKAQPTAFATSTDNCFARDKSGNLLPALTLSYGAHGGQLVPTDSTNTSFRLPTDDGTQVDVLYGQLNNGTRTGEFYRVRSPDGTVAFFGAEILPDPSAITAAAGSTVTGSSGQVDSSTWLEPVFNDSAASGCQDPTKIANPETGSTYCLQAWRWNADFVIDPHNNTTRYSYLPESNYYGFGTNKTPAWYDRGGVLSEIDYGWQLADVQTTGTTSPHQPAAKVLFNTANRCVDPSTDSVYGTGYGLGQAGCGSAAFTSVAANLVDTPTDQNCPSTGTANNQCQITTPTFWSTLRLASITTQAAVNGAYKNVDHWDLFDQFHTLDVASSPMWLAAIRHCAASAVGSNGICPQAVNGTANQQVLPDVQFAATAMAQRVPGVTGTNVPPNLPSYLRERIADIYDELGATTIVSYDDPTLNTTTGKSNYAPLGCTAPPTTAPDWHNTQLCYPEYWTAPGTSGPFTDWFQKYVVTSITTQDNTHAANVPAPIVTTSYRYGSSTSTIYSAPGSNGAGVAWHSNDSELVTDPNSRTYDQYRGFAVVTATTGAATDAPGHPQTQTVTTYLRGMDQDPDKAAATAGSCTSGTLTVAADCTPWNFTDDLSGVATRDDNALAGTVFEKQTIDSASGNVFSTMSNVPWISSPSADHTRISPLPHMRSRQLGTAQTFTRVPLASGANQVTQTRYWHDKSLGGAVVATDTLAPTVADGSSEVCTSTTFAAPDPSKPWMIGYANGTTTTAAPCLYATPAYTDPLPAAQSVGPVLAASHNYYDGGTGWPTTVLHGDVTRTDAQIDTLSPPTWQMRSTAGFDNYGRSLWTTDAAGAKSTTAYAPANPALTSMELPTDVTDTGPDPVTGALSWVSKTHLDSTRALPLTSTDPNGRTTYVTYDALGRTTAVWLPGRPYNPGSTTNPPPNSKFSYTVNGYVSGASTIAPSVVETDTLREDGTYAVSTTLLDSLGRTRQTQSVPPSDDAGRVVTDTSYDSAGRVNYVSGPYYDSSSAPSGGMWVAASQSAIPRQTQTQYDGLGRTTDVISIASANELWRTHTAYHGADRVDVTPPTGGARTSTVTDSHGRTSALYTYHASASYPATDPNSTDALTYRYDALGRNVETDQVADNAGHVNKWTFGYDMLGRKIAGADPDTGNSSYGYDLDGNLQTVTTAIGAPAQKSLYYTYDLLGRRTAEYAGTSANGTKLASWSYDSVPALTAAQVTANPGTDTRANLGRAAGSIRYSSSGAKYAESVGGYTAAGQPLSTSIAVPAADNNGALGGKTYTTVNRYTALGQLTNTDLPVGGDLQPDTVGYGYDVNGLLVGTSDSYADLLTDSSYTPYGEVMRRVLGDYPSQVVQDTVYDVPTRRVANSTVSQLAWNAPLDTTAYTYDPAGQITAAVDVQATAASLNSTTGIVSTTAATDAQCYHYDYAGRLDAAWTDTGSVSGTVFGSMAFTSGATGGSGTANQAGAPTNGALGGCANVAPTPGVTASWQIGGPEPYAQVFGYDNATGNRTAETDYSTSGAVSATNAYSYNAPGANQPYVLNSVNHTVGTTVITDNYQYDASGNTTQHTTLSGTQTTAQSNLSWDAENRLQGDSGGTGVASQYLYDADGNQLIRRDATTTTLYLGATELHLQLTGTGAGTVTGDRYFSYSGAPTIIETGTVTPKVSYEAGNLQGTAATTIDAAPATADKALTARRGYTPFNTPRGQSNTGGTWNQQFPDDHTFLGKTTDGSTGLVDVGARKYDPATGRFISADPVFQPQQPQDIGGYAYAGNDPVNTSDPTGLDPHTCAAGSHHDSSTGEMRCVPDAPEGAGGASGGSGGSGYTGCHCASAPAGSDASAAVERAKLRHWLIDALKILNAWHKLQQALAFQAAVNQSIEAAQRAAKLQCIMMFRCLKGDGSHFGRVGKFLSHISLGGSVCLIACVNASFQDWNLNLNLTGGFTGTSLKPEQGSGLDQLDPEEWITHGFTPSTFAGLSLDYVSARPKDQQTQIAAVSGADVVGANAAVGTRTNGKGLYYQGGLTLGAGGSLQGPPLGFLNFAPGGVTAGSPGGSATGSWGDILSSLWPF